MIALGRLPRALAAQAFSGKVFGHFDTSVRNPVRLGCLDTIGRIMCVRQFPGDLSVQVRATFADADNNEVVRKILYFTHVTPLSKSSIVQPIACAIFKRFSDPMPRLPFSTSDKNDTDKPVFLLT